MDLKQYAKCRYLQAIDEFMVPGDCESPKLSARRRNSVAFISRKSDNCAGLLLDVSCQPLSPLFRHGLESRQVLGVDLAILLCADALKVEATSARHGNSTSSAAANRRR